jgi:hypothetical protein
MYSIVYTTLLEALLINRSGGRPSAVANASQNCFLLFLIWSKFESGTWSLKKRHPDPNRSKNQKEGESGFRLGLL